MLKPKDYQCRVLDALRDYFAECKRLGSADAAFRESTAKWFDRALNYSPVRELPGLPYVCLRVPTGGGKTLVAAHAAGIAQRDLLQADRSLILWLVPSNAIREQTMNALKSKRHPYRLALEEGTGPVEVMDVGEALSIQRAALDGQTVVIVATVQAFRVEETEGRKVYADSGALMTHFTGIDPSQSADLEKHENGVPIRSLANVLRLRRPIVLVDEAHNARTNLSFETLARFNPSCILEFTATPDLERTPSNVLYTVSAAELKSEQMVKLPIKLKTRSNWKELLADAYAARANLEKLALEVQKTSGEYIRPMMLLQAQPDREGTDCLTYEVLKKALIEDFKVPDDQIAIVTGGEDGLKGMNPSSPECPVKYVITVQALKEGWDCPFAYVLYSVAEMRASRSVEQILGRIMRLPQARSKAREELNVAYAFVTSEDFGKTASNLTDALIANGFEKQEARDLIVQADDREQGEFFGNPGEFWNEFITIELPEVPDSTPLSSEAQAILSLDHAEGTMTVRAAITQEVREELEARMTTKEGKAKIAEAYERAARKWGGPPSRHKPPISVPLLSIRQGDLLETFEENHLLEREWSLQDCEANLTEEELPSERPKGRTGEIDIAKDGRVTAELTDSDFLEKLTGQMAFLGANEGWSKVDLIRWLDARIPHTDIPPDDSQLFIMRMVEGLIEGRGIGLERLVLDKYRVRQAAAAKIDQHRAKARRDAFQAILFEDEAKVVVSHKNCFTYDPSQYPHGKAYRGGFKFRRHFYPVVGDLPSEGEEFECARFIDGLDEVESWVRNLARRDATSFWLQTATDKFYPDFVCLLKDGRYLVIEYKGGDRSTNDDSKEKRLLGELWEKRSGGQCLFVMPTDQKFGVIETKIRGTA